MPLRKIPEHAPVEDGEDDAELLKPIKLAAQRSFERRRREAANRAKAASGGAGPSDAPATFGGGPPSPDLPTAPELRRTVSLPVSGAYTEALRHAQKLMAKLNLRSPPTSAARRVPLPMSSSVQHRPSLTTAAAEQAPVLQRTMSSPTTSSFRRDREEKNVRRYSAGPGEPLRYSFKSLLSERTTQNIVATDAQTKQNVADALADPEDLASCPESALLSYALQLSMQDGEDAEAPEEDLAASNSGLQTVEQLLSQQSSGDIFGTSGSVTAAVTAPAQTGAAPEQASAAAGKKAKKAKKEKKKKKKKKSSQFSYKNYLKSALKSTRSRSDHQEIARKHISKVVGGGQFSKHTEL